MTVEDRRKLMDGLSADDKLTMVIPTLAAMDFVLDGDLGDDVGAKVRDRAFDGFAALGFDRATKTGAVTEMIGGHVEDSLRRTLTDDRFAREFFGYPAKENASPTEDDRLAQILAAVSKLPGMIEGISSREGVPEVPAYKKVPTFSDATRSLVTHIRETKKANHPDVGTVERVSEAFLALKGNKLVNQYGKKDIQDYINSMSFVTPNFMKKNPGATMKDLKKHIEDQRGIDAPGLSHSTLENTYLDRVRTIIRHGCDEADTAFPLAGKKIDIPERAATKRKRRPLTSQQVNDVFREAGRSKILSDVLLPLLGYMIGRRIGLLCHIRFEWLRNEDNAWLVYPEEIIRENGREWEVPVKGDASLEPFVLHQTFCDIGLTSWMMGNEDGAPRKSGWLFPWLAVCDDPADAAQKRMKRLFRKAGCNSASLETFHTLRSNRIAADFDLKLDPRVKRLQVGHELLDVHEGYAGVLSQTDAQILRHLPVKEGIDLTPFYGHDFDVLAARKPTGGNKKKPV